jgi:hypothetical protein
MRHPATAAAIAALAIASAAMPAAAFDCYVLVDASNEVIYQGVQSPLDLSDEGAAERNAMRARSQQLIAMDTDRCPPIDRMRVAGKEGPASVEEIIAGMRPAIAFGSGAAGATRDAVPPAGDINLPRITVPRATGGGLSPAGPPSGMSIR